MVIGGSSFDPTDIFCIADELYEKSIEQGERPLLDQAVRTARGKPPAFAEDSSLTKDISCLPIPNLHIAFNCLLCYYYQK